MDTKANWITETEKSFGRQKRSLSMRQRKEIQEMLWKVADKICRLGQVMGLKSHI
jgi:hypothetical protein